MRQPVIAILLIASGITGCGAPNSTENNAQPSAQGEATSAQPGMDPCGLVTTEEVAAVIGDKIVSKAAGEGSCQYQTAGGAASSITIEIKQGDGAGDMEIARLAAGTMKDMGASVAAQSGAGADVNSALSASGDAPRIGDEAFFGPNQQLSVRKGNVYFSVLPPITRSRMTEGNPMIPAEEKKKMAIAIAEKAVARLQ